VRGRGGGRALHVGELLAEGLPVQVVEAEEVLLRLRGRGRGRVRVRVRVRVGVRGGLGWG